MNYEWTNELKKYLDLDRYNCSIYKCTYIIYYIYYIYINIYIYIYLIVKFRCRNQYINIKNLLILIYAPAFFTASIVTSLWQPMLHIVVCWAFYNLLKKLCRYSKSIKNIHQTNVRIFLPLTLNICMKNLSVWSIVFAWHEKQKYLHVRQTYN